MFLTISGLGCVPPKPCLFIVLPEDWYSYMYPSPCIVLGLSSFPGRYGRGVCGGMKEAERVFQLSSTTGWLYSEDSEQKLRNFKRKGRGQGEQSARTDQKGASGSDQGPQGSKWLSSLSIQRQATTPERDFHKRRLLQPSSIIQHSLKEESTEHYLHVKLCVSLLGVWNAF